MSAQSGSNSQTQPTEPSEVSVQFMLSEMERISDRWTHADQLAEGRLNMLITLTSGASGVLLLLSQLRIASNDFLAVASVIFAFIWLLGLMTFLRMLERNLTVVGYIRAINRIRRFFVDNVPNIERYLALPITDSEPKYTNLGIRKFGARTVSAIISSLAFGLLCGDIFSLATSAIQITTTNAMVGIVGFIIHLLITETYAAFRLRSAEQNYEVRFPTNRREKEELSLHQVGD